VSPRAPMAASQQAERRVLLVEDETLVAMLIEDMVRELGWDVVAIAARVDEALEIVRTTPIDVAILDINLQGAESFPVAEALRARGIPFVFATGYGQGGLENGYRSTPTLQKPFHRRDLELAISRALALIR
jgi:CheY-like chemotaxis protein